MKTLLKCAFGCALLTIFAYSRLLYVHFSHVHNKESVIGEALDPLNQFAILALLLFGAATFIFLLLATVGYLAYRYDLKHPLPDSETSRDRSDKSSPPNLIA